MISDVTSHASSTRSMSDAVGVKREHSNPDSYNAVGGDGVFLLDDSQGRCGCPQDSCLMMVERRGLS